jgi:hypothetical protein
MKDIKMKSVMDILYEYLNTHGYDGLFYPGECSCLKEDLILCESDPRACIPGYKVECRCGEGCDWDIAGEKEEVEKK